MFLSGQLLKFWTDPSVGSDVWPAHLTPWINPPVPSVNTADRGGTGCLFPPSPPSEAHGRQAVRPEGRSGGRGMPQRCFKWAVTILILTLPIFSFGHIKLGKRQPTQNSLNKLPSSADTEPRVTALRRTTHTTHHGVWLLSPLLTAIKHPLSADATINGSSTRASRAASSPPSPSWKGLRLRQGQPAPHPLPLLLKAEAPESCQGGSGAGTHPCRSSPSR